MQKALTHTWSTHQQVKHHLFLLEIKAEDFFSKVLAIFMIQETLNLIYIAKTYHKIRRWCVDFQHLVAVY